jgi:hypothetical protein
MIMIFLGAFLTGLGVYDRIGKFAGGGSIVPIRYQYIRDNFMTRYSEYYYSPEFLRIPAKERETRFNLTPSYNVFYKPFICSRQKGNVREETLHLINLPEKGGETGRYYNKVAVRKNLTLTVIPRKNEKILEAIAVTPQLEKAVKLVVKGNKIQLPALDDAMIVVVRYKK